MALGDVPVGNVGGVSAPSVPSAAIEYCAAVLLMKLATYT